MSWPRKARILAVVALAVAGFCAAMIVGRMTGAEAAARSHERLQLVWPSIMTMPVNDRALIVGLAMSCRLEQRPVEAGEVVACLREAAASPDAMLPNGVDRASVPARLEQLIP